MPEKIAFNHWDNVVAEARNNVVFENRNQVYGAYQIRRYYNRTLVIALVTTIAAFSILACIPKVISLMSNKIEEIAVPGIPTESILINLTPKVEPIKMFVPPAAQKPVKTTLKFTPFQATNQDIIESPKAIETIDKPIGIVTNIIDDGSTTIIDNTPIGKGENPVKTIEEVMISVDKMPKFPGGEVKLMEFLYANLQYPEYERGAGISGPCFVTFVVEKDGKITGIRILKGVPHGSGCDEEALRVLKMMPNWDPGSINGRAVRVQFNLPIRFTLGG